MSDINKSRRKLIVGSSALAAGSLLTGGGFTKSAIAQSLSHGVSYEELNIPGVNSLAPFVSMPTEAKMFLRQQIADLIRWRLEKSYGDLLGKVIGKTLLGAIAPAVAIIFDLLFPSGVSMEGIREEIDKRIKSALDEYEFTQVQKKFIALIDAYSLRMESVQANNSGNSDQSSWNLGTPSEWEALIFCCLELKNYFYNNSDFTRYYEAAHLVNDFNTIYYIALNSRLQCFKDGDDVGKTVELLEELLKGQYDYLEKLANTAYYDIHSHRDTAITDWGTPIGQWRTVNTYPSGNPNTNSTSLSGYDKYDNIRWTHDMIRERNRLYHFLNTEVMNMCETHSIVVQSFNSLFKKDLPDAKVMAKGFINTYVGTMNDLYRKSPYADGGGYAGLTLPAFSSGIVSENAPFTSDDPYVFVQHKDDSSALLFSPGDYPNLLNSNIAGGIGLNITDIRVPRGFKVMLYDYVNFNEYKASGSDEVKYRGQTYLKPLEGVVDFSDRDSLPKFIVKSMKVRIDPAHWFSEIKEKTIGRLPLVEYKHHASPGVDVWSTGHIVIAEKP